MTLKKVAHHLRTTPDVIEEKFLLCIIIISRVKVNIMDVKIHINKVINRKFPQHRLDLSFSLLEKKLHTEKIWIFYVLFAGWFRIVFIFQTLISHYKKINNFNLIYGALSFCGYFLQSFFLIQFLSLGMKYILCMVRFTYVPAGKRWNEIFLYFIPMSGSPSAFLNFMTFSCSHTIKLKSGKIIIYMGMKSFFWCRKGRRNIFDAKSSKNLLMVLPY